MCGAFLYPKEGRQMRLQKPLKGDYPVGGTFGPRRSFRLPDGRWTLDFHYGTDFPANQWTPIHAMHDGEVTFSGFDWSGYGGGNQVQVTSGGWSSFYLHMAQNPSVHVGQQVKSGQLIGYVGSTGASKGAHLHIELHRNGVAVDPEHYFGRKPAPTTIEDDDEMKPTVHYRTEGPAEWSRVHPDIGRDLAAGKSRKDGSVTVYRGFEATASKSVGIAWARTHTRGSGKETSRTNRNDYIQIQAQATRLSVAIHG